MCLAQEQIYFDTPAYFDIAPYPTHGFLIQSRQYVQRFFPHIHLYNRNIKNTIVYENDFTFNDFIHLLSLFLYK